jgi:hypothetical protein
MGGRAKTPGPGSCLDSGTSAVHRTSQRKTCRDAVHVRLVQNSNIPDGPQLQGGSICLSGRILHLVSCIFTYAYMGIGIAHVVIKIPPNCSSGMDM